MPPSSELKKAYRSRRQEIARRLKDFRKFRHAPEPRIFEELCFCLLTPGAKAENCKRIVASLKKEGLLFEGRRQELWPFLKYARFYDQKAHRLVEARQHRLKDKIFSRDPFKTRLWLVDHVKGLGYKEASHFLRNLGQGEDLAILDRHILKRLKALRVINDVPKTLTPKKYLEIEKKMRGFSKRVRIPLGAMDLLFFSQATGKPVRCCK